MACRGGKGREQRSPSPMTGGWVSTSCQTRYRPARFSRLPVCGSAVHSLTRCTTSTYGVRLFFEEQSGAGLPKTGGDPAFAVGGLAPRSYGQANRGTTASVITGETMSCLATTKVAVSSSVLTPVRSIWCFAYPRPPQFLAFFQGCGRGTSIPRLHQFISGSRTCYLTLPIGSASRRVAPVG